MISRGSESRSPRAGWRRVVYLLWYFSRAVAKSPALKKLVPIVFNAVATCNAISGSSDLTFSSSSGLDDRNAPKY